VKTFHTIQVIKKRKQYFSLLLHAGWLNTATLETLIF